MHTDSLLKLAFRLVKNGLRFRYLRFTGKPGKPLAVSLEVTHNCIAKCIMCNIWKIPGQVPNLPLAEHIRILSSELLSDIVELDITGGEPFLRDDLPDLFSAISDLKKNHAKSLQAVAVTSNGFLTSRILADAEKILPKLRDVGIDLIMVCAMDAVGELHERIRNYKNAWAKVDQTVQGLKALRNKFPNLIIGLKTTVLPLNVGELDKIADYADINGLFTIISPCIITKGRYLNPDLADALIFSPKDIEAMIQFFQGESSRWSYHENRLVRYFQKGVIKKPCTCGFNYFFVRSNGDMFLCPLLDESVGNVRKVPLEKLFSSEKASRMRRRIGRFPQCRQCTEPGLERYALPYEGFTYLHLLLKMGRKRFLQLHCHLGLDKYFR